MPAPQLHVNRGPQLHGEMFHRDRSLGPSRRSTEAWSGGSSGASTVRFGTTTGRPKGTARRIARSGPARTGRTATISPTPEDGGTGRRRARDQL
jgi:hypothetical protein